ncbi:MAG: hypothetical protein K9I92_04160, partial [Chitinophagaceae bacterium]|nr:hypothetical protein [Chitinophagaceae bacterium]
VNVVFSKQEMLKTLFRKRIIFSFIDIVVQVVRRYSPLKNFNTCRTDRHATKIKNLGLIGTRE